VSKLVRQEFGSTHRTGVVSMRRENHVGAHGERLGAHRARRLCRVRVSVNPHGAEVVAKPCVHGRARAGVQRHSLRMNHVVHARSRIEPEQRLIADAPLQ